MDWTVSTHADGSVCHLLVDGPYVLAVNECGPGRWVWSVTDLRRAGRAHRAGGKATTWRLARLAAVAAVACERRAVA